MTFDDFLDRITLPLIGYRAVTQSATNRGVHLLRIHLNQEHYMDPEKIPDAVLMSLVLEACWRAGEEEEDKVPRFRHYYHHLKGVAAEAAAASRGELSAPSRVRSLLEFYGIV